MNVLPFLPVAGILFSCCIAAAKDAPQPVSTTLVEEMPVTLQRIQTTMEGIQNKEQADISAPILTECAATIKKIQSQIVKLTEEERQTLEQWAKDTQWGEKGFRILNACHQAGLKLKEKEFYGSQALKDVMIQSYREWTEPRKDHKTPDDATESGKEAPPAS